jgi:hypothetical protein
MSPHPLHPKRTRARVLLSSVFGPYAQDDAYGSRRINPMELYHNQVTRFQGPFSLRMFHRSFGLMMIQTNIEAPCTLLDFPDIERFVQEIRDNDYDVVGIGAIIPNIGKVAEMCTLVRRYLPRATIIIGGHVANVEAIDRIVDADHIVKGDGVAWFRRYLGQDDGAPVRHPMAYSGIGARTMGMTLRDRPGDTAAILVPSVGCPVGCNFCSTSALFGGKGKYIDFYETGDALFDVMVQLEKGLKVQSFFVLDENFLLHRKRALRLLELMQSHQKSWSLFVFSSARVLSAYTMEQLVGIGCFLGLDGAGRQREPVCQTEKCRRPCTGTEPAVSRHPCARFIHIRARRSPAEEMDQVIAYAVSYRTDFHQFMLYTPNPGTPLYAQHQADGTLLDESAFAPADAHGQYRFNYRHAHIPPGMEEQFLHRAFQQDFAVNGPSLARLIQTQLAGWIKYSRHSDPRIRKRYAGEAKTLGTTYTAAVWAMRRWYTDNAAMAAKMDRLLQKLYGFFGMRTRFSAPVVGRFLQMAIHREERRLAQGWTYEPSSFYEKNPAAQAIVDRAPERPRTRANRIGWVESSAQPV